MRRFILALPALMLTATACGAGESGSDGPITIGYITSLTGNYSALGTDNEKAVELAVEQINEDGGVLGRELELVTRDDQSQANQSVVAFDEIMNEDPAAVIGSPFSNSALATIPRVEREEVPYLSTTPADEQVEPIRPYVFVTPATAKTYAERMLEYFEAEGIDKIAVAHDSQGSYPTAGYEGMQIYSEKYGVDVVEFSEFQTDTKDFSHLFTAIGETEAQALAFWGTGAPGVIATQQYAESELDIPLVMTGSQASQLWLEPVGDAAEGVTVLSSIGMVGDYLPEGEQKETITEMVSAFEDKHDYPAPQFAQDGYSAVMLLTEAIEQAESTDREAIRDALEGLTLTTPNGEFTYSEEDHSGLGPEHISVNTVEDGEFVPTEWAQEQFDQLGE